MANIINGTDTGSGGLITTGDSSDELQLQTAETARVTLTNTAVVVNEDGNDVDFRVESDTVDHALFVDGATGNIGIGKTPGTRILDIAGEGQTGANNVDITWSTTSSGYAPGLNFKKSNGTQASPTVVSSGDQLGIVLFAGYDGSSYQNAAYIESRVDGTPGANDMPGRLVFFTTADGSASPTERMRLTSDGYLRMASGSGGIQFGGDTAAANALDDYEEGTWTPIFGGSAGNGTLSYGTRQGRYTKVGNMVTCWARIDAASTVTGGSGNLQIEGLPFAAATDASLGWFGHSTIGYFDGLSAYGTSTDDLKLLGPNNNSTFVRFHTFTNAAVSTPLTQAQITANTALYVGFSYQV